MPSMDIGFRVWILGLRAGKGCSHVKAGVGTLLLFASLWVLDGLEAGCYQRHTIWLAVDDKVTCTCQPERSTLKYPLLQTL